MTERPTRNWPRLLLITVLALSLLGNAVTLGAALRLQALKAELLGPSAGALVYPPQLRSGLHRAIAAHADTLLPALHAVIAAREQVIATGTARPFDRGAVLERMAAFRQLTDALLEQVQAVYLEELERQSQE